MVSLAFAAAVAGSATGGTSAPTPLSVREYPVPAGSRPHDVAPARDGGGWYTAQGSGERGWRDPKTGRTRHVALGDAQERVVWRLDPNTRRVRRFPLPAGSAYANLNTAVFDRRGILWFTGQSGIYGRLDPRTGRLRVFRAPRGEGPYGITVTPSGVVYYASLAGSYLGRIERATGEVEVLEPPTAGAGVRRVWSDPDGR